MCNVILLCCTVDCSTVMYKVMFSISLPVHLSEVGFAELQPPAYMKQPSSMYLSYKT